jgi:hypothetical protein
MRPPAFLFATICLSAAALSAQQPDMSCRDQKSNGKPASCEVRESTMAAVPALTVDGRQNGGISIKGANRNDILVRAMVQTRAGSDADAKALAKQVNVTTAAGRVAADGPLNKDWSVSYEVFVPTSTKLTLNAKNGGIAVQKVESAIEFHTVNGGVNLSGVAGNVHGETVNGGLNIELAGARWVGTGMEIGTTNGGVQLHVPAGFSADLDVSTVNGGLKVDLPGANVPSGRNNLSVKLGAGGPPVKIRTVNGGVTISSRNTSN